MPETIEDDDTTLPGVEFDWHDDGVLWLVNSTVFHPRGFALAREPESGDMRLIGDGSEPWVYEDGAGLDDLFVAVADLFARAARENRPEPVGWQLVKWDYEWLDGVTVNEAWVGRSDVGDRDWAEHLLRRHRDGYPGDRWAIRHTDGRVVTADATVTQTPGTVDEPDEEHPHG